jgi:hypothetical protein
MRAPPLLRALVIATAALVAVVIVGLPRPAAACYCTDPISDFICCKCHLVLPCPVSDASAEAAHAVDEVKAVASVADETVQKQNADDELDARCSPGPLSPTVSIDLGPIALAPRINALPALGKHAQIAGKAIGDSGSLDASTSSKITTAFAQDGVGINPDTGSWLAFWRRGPEPKAFARQSLVDAYALAQTMLADQALIADASRKIAKATSEASKCQRTDFQTNTEARLLMTVMTDRLTTMIALLSVVRYQADVIPH